MPIVYMLIGVPGSGKSTWAKDTDLPVASSDDWVEELSRRQGLTYTEGFRANIEAATEHMYRAVQGLVEAEQDFIWDQTNLSSFARMQKLSKIPDSYRTIAIYFPTPEREELERRLAQRTDKQIPMDVIDSMMKNIEAPTLDEFDAIIAI